VSTSEDYQRHRANADELARRAGRSAATWGLLRLAVFVAAAFAVAIAVTRPGIGTFAIAAVGIAGFFAVGLFQFAADDRHRRERRLRAWFDAGLARCHGAWPDDAPDGAEFLPEGHSLGRDCDLFGRRSLFQGLCTSSGEGFRRHLAERLRDPAWDERRGDRVAALRGEHRWRARLAARGESDRPAVRDPFLDWLDGDAPPHPVALRWGLNALSAAAISAIVAVGVLHGPGPGFLAFILACVPAIALDSVGRRQGALDVDGSLLEGWARELADGYALLREGRRGEGEGGIGSAEAALRRLERIAGGLAQRRNPVWSHAVGALLLAEWRNTDLLRRWRRDHGADLAGWLATLHEVEVDAACATWAAERGGVAATIEPDAPTFRFADLAHPLLDAESRVGNDLELRRGSVLLLTGANASGKSTFLRSIALAVVMARAGLPVCSRECRMPPVHLETVMRVSDDLAAGRSRFQNEVEALAASRERVHAAELAPVAILDEILAGTNSEERHLGAEAVIRDLHRSAALVLVSTHDLALASLADEDTETFVCMHFADDADTEDLRFDYRLRPGVLQTTNALKVMRRAGLPVEG